MTEVVREVTSQDLETTMRAIQACGLFSPEEIPTLRAQLEKTLSGQSERNEFWLADFGEEGEARGVTFCVEEVLTDRVWNLLFIGVAEGMQNTGIGGRLLRHVEDRLRQDSQRMLVIETTNGPEFEGARAFYESHQYTEEGTVRDFYAEGAHKIAFRKVLSPKASDTPQGG